MTGDGKTHSRGDALLQALDLFVLKLEDQAAFGADQVVVVLAGYFVSGLSIAKLAFVRQSRFDEELESAIDRGVADLAIALSNPGKQLLDGYVIFRSQKLIDNGVALLGGVKALGLEVITPPFL